MDKEVEEFLNTYHKISRDSENERAIRIRRCPDLDSEFLGTHAALTRKAREIASRIILNEDVIIVPFVLQEIIVMLIVGGYPREVIEGLRRSMLRLMALQRKQMEEDENGE